MAPTRTVLAKHLRKPKLATHPTSTRKPNTSSSSSTKTNGKTTPHTSTHPSFARPSSAASKAGAKQHKPKPVRTPTVAQQRFKKRRIYSEKELAVPTLNMITPVGVEKPRRGKKGKVFVDDGPGLMTILKMVEAEVEGQVEGKMMRARQMEEIREARKAELEKKAEARKGKLVSGSLSEPVLSPFESFGGGCEMVG